MKVILEKALKFQTLNHKLKYFCESTKKPATKSRFEKIL